MTEESRKPAGEGETRFRSLFRDSVVGMAVVAPTGEFLQANPAFCEFLGYSEQELLGQTVQSVTYPEDWEASSKAIQQALTSGPRIHRFDKRYLHKRGQVLWGEVSMIVVCDAEGKPSYLISQVLDITDRKRAEEALQRERVFTNAVLDSIPGLPYLFDAEGRLVRWNKKQAKMTGYSEEELAHIHITDWFRGEEAGYIAARMAKAFAEGYADAEATLVTKDGTRIPFYFTGVRLILDGKMYLAGMGIDISRRKAAEEAIRKSETLYRTLFQSANDAIFILKHDVFSDCNPMATCLFGYPREALIGHSPVEFSPARQADGRDSAEVAGEKIRAALDGKPQFFGWTAPTGGRLAADRRDFAEPNGSLLRTDAPGDRARRHGAEEGRGVLARALPGRRAKPRQRDHHRSRRQHRICKPAIQPTDGLYAGGSKGEESAHSQVGAHFG